MEAAQANVVSSPAPDTALSTVCKHIWTNAQKGTFFLSYCIDHASPTAFGNALEIYFEKYFLFCSRPVAMETMPNVLATHCYK